MTIQAQNDDIVNNVKDIAKRLLEEGSVDLIIGYTKGTIPLKAPPFFVKKPEDVERLTWDNLGYTNLAKYLLVKRKKKIEDKEVDLKVGIIAKGCVGRAIVQLAVEKQLKRENVMIIGFPCNGLIDTKRIEKELSGKEILNASVQNDEIIVKGKDFEKIYPFEEYTMALCKTCKNRTPLVLDVLAGENNNTTVMDDFFDVTTMEAQTPEQKWEHINGVLGDCIRCNACRQACPVCYCNLCFVDQNKPIWFDKTFDRADIFVFHLIRSLHLAGRCVSCGACYGACPVGIDLNVLNRKLEKLAKERFDFVAGTNIETLPPMMAFKMDDSQEFMVEE
ncbi:MAG TPA: Coenzyme F420 hydrogenase/dehydrogenase, beta subunit C-terminal domain [Candidatus Lokiarchaeia archaeon]|nr:Coenzyme F420 hydrogenase/dehydrogenase, beta subunit C-terminal domain [Candidatus Lokiarchaeia archaeon]